LSFVVSSLLSPLSTTQLYPFSSKVLSLGSNYIKMVSFKPGHSSPLSRIAFFPVFSISQHTHTHHTASTDGWDCFHFWNQK
jgi:hypothetical protein